MMASVLVAAHLVMVLSIFSVVDAQTTEPLPTLFPPSDDDHEADGEHGRQKAMAGDYYNTFHNLHLQVLQSYNHHLRPEIGAGKPLMVNFSMVITHLVQVDEDTQTIDLAGWIILQWYDHRLAWNDSTEFKDIDKLLMQQKVIWKPDMHLYNNAQSKLDYLVNPNVQAQIYSNGRVTLDPTFNLRPYCQFNYKAYPWDMHKCAVYLGSWSYRIQELKWQLRPITSEQVPIVFSNSHRIVPTNWRIVQAISQLADVDFDNEYWHYVNITFYFKRTPTFAANLILLPVATGAVLMGLAFLSSAGRGDWKLTILLLALILEVAHFIAIHFIVPQGVINGEPLILTFCKANILLTLIALIVAFIVKCVSDRRDDPPSWLARILENRILNLACCFFDDSSADQGTRYSPRIGQNRRQGERDAILETNKIMLPRRSQSSVDEKTRSATSSKAGDTQNRHDEDRNEGRSEALWWRLGVLVDRVLFVIVAIIFAILWSCYVGF